MSIRLLWQTMNENGKTVWYGRCFIISKLNALALLTWKEVSLLKYRVFLDEFLLKGFKKDQGKLHTANTQDVIKRRKIHMGDTITVSEINLFSSAFFVNIFRKVPMVVSINIGEQFKTDREDTTLDDLVYDDWKKSWHATVIYGRSIADSRWDQKRYSLTRAFMLWVKGLRWSQKVLVFKKS